MKVFSSFSNWNFTSNIKKEDGLSPVDLLIEDLWNKIISQLHEFPDILHLGNSCTPLRKLAISFLQENYSVLLRHIKPSTIQNSEKLFSSLNLPYFKFLTNRYEPICDTELKNFLVCNKQTKHLVIESKLVSSCAFRYLPGNLQTLTLINCIHVDSSAFPFLPPKLVELNLNNCPFVLRKEVTELNKLRPDIKVTLRNDKTSLLKQFDFYLITLEVKIACTYWILKTGQHLEFLDILCDKARTLDQLEKSIDHYSDELSLPQYEKAFYLKSELKDLLQDINRYKTGEMNFKNDFGCRFLKIQKGIQQITRPSLYELIFNNFWHSFWSNLDY